MPYPLLIPEWMSSEELSQALVLLQSPDVPLPLPESLQRLTLEDWSDLFLAHQLLMLARQRESLH